LENYLSKGDVSARAGLLKGGSQGALIPEREKVHTWRGGEGRKKGDCRE